MSIFSNFTGHLTTITKHKLLVMKYCFKAGLYKQGLLHDLSKYSPTEFIPGVRYYQGTRSPNAAQKETEGFSGAWLHHKGRNKHHFEYWIDYPVDKTKGICGMRMPEKYVVEMFCDRIAASKIYRGSEYTDRDSLDYFLKGYRRYVIHEDSERLLYTLLRMLSVKGEDYTFKYIRNKILK